MAKAMVREYACISLINLQGLKVVGIDARPEPIKLAMGMKLAPDLCFDATKTTAEDAVKEIVKLRPDGYEGWDGVDGGAAPKSELTNSHIDHLGPPFSPAIRYGHHTAARSRRFRIPA